MSTAPERSETSGRGTLTREGILAAGLEIGRREELSRLTMKKLADALGVTPMAIYRHFRNKAEIVDGVLDLFVREAAVTSHGVPRGEWRRWLQLTFGAMRHGFIATPGVMPFLSRTSRFGASALAVLDETLGVLRDAGFDDTAAVDTFTALAGYTIGSSALEATWQTRRRESQEDAEERLRRTRLAIESTPRAEHPNVVATAAPLARVMEDAPFELGLDVLIDGLAARAGVAPARQAGVDQTPSS